MCTALSLHTKDHYFGRNLDLDGSYGEEVTVMPRRFPLRFREMGPMPEHYAMIGMATVVDGLPLYYDAVNEHGVAMAGLNFPGNAFYAPAKPGCDNVAPFEFIPWVLSQCRNLAEVRALLERIHLADIAYSAQIPPAPLHWMISFQDESIVAESMEDGLHVHENPAGVLTNNPPFPFHLFHLNNFRNLKTTNGGGEFADALSLSEYCQGLGAMGLPGDVSSMSRFVRAAFGRANSVCAADEMSSVSQFFHLLTSVEMTLGVCSIGEGKWDITVFSACMNADRGLYYYTTYNNRRITCVDMHHTGLDGSAISRFPLIWEQQVQFQN